MLFSAEPLLLTCFILIGSVRSQGTSICATVAIDAAKLSYLRFYSKQLLVLSNRTDVALRYNKRGDTHVCCIWLALGELELGYVVIHSLYTMNFALIES